jgi:FMN phosphatase YigB (HAD superfamily)
VAEIAYVGDRLDNDVMPARRAGMRTVLLRRGPWGYLHAERPEAALADAVTDSLASLPELLRSW